MAQNEPEVVRHFKISGLETMYTLFLALLIALFFGLGVSAFYPAPEVPDYPTVLNTSFEKDGSMNNDQKAAQIKYDADMKKYQDDSSIYTRNVSMITLALAVAAMTISLAFLDDIYIMANGVLLGGVFTLVYSMIRGFMTDDTKYRFIIVTVGLLVTLVIGYIKFIRPSRPKITSK